MDHDGLAGRPPTKLSIVEARNLVFAYGTTAVVSDVSLSIPRGAVGALIGANGSGKSTLIRLLAGLLTPSSGEVFVEGAALAGMALRERAKRVAYVPQSTSMVFPFTGIEVVLTGRSPYGGRFSFESNDDEQIALAALDSLDAVHLANRQITEMSGGERQLITVARSLAQDPDIMLLDEPGSALDLKHRAQLSRALRRLGDERGIASLMITHDLMSLDCVVDLIFAMKSGRMIAMGQPESVLVEPILSDIYDARVKTERNRARIFVWAEL